MSEQDNLTPLERINVNRALSTMREALKNAVPFEITKESVQRVVDSLLETVRSTVPKHFEVIASVGSDPHTIEVTITGTLPLIMSPDLSLADFHMTEQRDDTIKDYFHEEVEYPNDIAENPLPLGRLLSYVSSTFLNGFINYVHPIEAAILNRYVPLDWDMTEVLMNRSYQEPAGSFNWKPFSAGMTKKELIEVVTQPNRLASADLGLFGDDIILLATAKTDPTVYYFFWFDQDVSDCQIGRFRTSDDVEIVHEKFNKFVEKLSFGHTQLPLHFFSAGWTVF